MTWLKFYTHIIGLLLLGRWAIASPPDSPQQPTVPASQPSATMPASQPSAATPTTQPKSEYQTTVVGTQPAGGPTPGRASTKVTRRQLDERAPRSAPDALRYEPGVYVQQTAHSQGSAYIRGRTGQQTVLLFDGIRLNNSTFRQGPNQYFFTIDSRTIRRIDVLRGGASTLYGSDAIGGAINALPTEPRYNPQNQGLTIRPGGMLRFASADTEFGGRAQLNAQLGQQLSAFGGVGYRRIGQLRSGGRLDTPEVGNTPAGGWVPRFEQDGKTQLGTGFKELASDLRVHYQLTNKLRLVAAYYDYRQLDAPRTDKCPPAEAPISACLTFNEQFRSIGYLALEGSLNRWIKTLRIALSYQNQHEERIDQRPSSFVQNGGQDDTHTLGIVGQFTTEVFELVPWAALQLSYGGDFYFDWLQSTAWTQFTDTEQLIDRTRGQYLTGSRYGWGGAFVQPQWTLWRQLILRMGARLSGIFAQAPGDLESTTAAIDRHWITGVGQVGMEWQILPSLSLLTNIDRSFRAPNLDDLTSRQDTGPGFQIENPELSPETALTTELGLRFKLAWLQTEIWGYWASLNNAIERQPRPLAECPQSTGRSCLRLVNLANTATVWGTEVHTRLSLPGRIALRATLAWALGTGTNPADSSLPDVPLSRIPPLNGTAELRWKHHWGIYLGGAVRWALRQPRLSLGDESDPRIPPQGTPGFAVVDIRLGYRLSRQLIANVVFENIGDTAYRYHGSSVNGPGRGLVVSLEGSL